MAKKDVVSQGFTSKAQEARYEAAWAEHDRRALVWSRLMVAWACRDDGVTVEQVANARRARRRASRNSQTAFLQPRKPDPPHRSNSQPQGASPETVGPLFVCAIGGAGAARGR